MYGTSEIVGMHRRHHESDDFLCLHIICLMRPLQDGRFRTAMARIWTNYASFMCTSQGGNDNPKLHVLQGMSPTVIRSRQKV